jgi:hypothetical protein
MLERAVLSVVMDWVRPGWRQRKARRKSIWHLPLIVVMVVLFVGVWFALFHLMWQIHLVLHPAHAGHLDEFLQRDVRGFPLVGSLLLLLPLGLPAFGIAAVVANLLFWCVAPARKTFEREAAGDPEMSFRGATGTLAKATLLYLVPIGAGLSLVGAWILTALR